MKKIKKSSFAKGFGGQRQKITKNMGISEILQKYPEAFKVFLKYNLPCVGCAAAHFENLEAIAEEFNINIEKLLKDLNKAIK